MKLKLKKIKRGRNGVGDEYQYGDKILVTTKLERFRKIYDKKDFTRELFYSVPYEDYRPFMKRFREHLEKIEKQVISKNDL